MIFFFFAIFCVFCIFSHEEVSFLHLGSQKQQKLPWPGQAVPRVVTPSRCSFSRRGGSRELPCPPWPQALDPWVSKLGDWEFYLRPLVLGIPEGCPGLGYDLRETLMLP